MANFNDYGLHEIAHSEGGVYELADGLLPEMSHALEFDLGSGPSEDALRSFIGHIGPAKTLQDNIETVQRRLATEKDAVEIAAGWVERAGVLLPVERSFASNEAAVPSRIDTATFMGGVARWMLRRAARIESQIGQGLQVGRVVITTGNRTMGENEHALVAEYASKEGFLPNETEFAGTYIVPRLRSGGIDTKLVPEYSNVGDEILERAVEDDKAWFLDGTVLNVSNAPAAVFTAGQFRHAAKKFDTQFDADGMQLFMTADGIEVARRGEGAETHQNPFSALGQIARNALIIHQNAQVASE